MSSLSKQILEAVEILTTEKQQQVLDFVQFLGEKQLKKNTEEIETTTQSFFEVAQSSIGAGEGPGDLSTNRDYMQGYGE